MTYHVGIGLGMASIGIRPCEPHISCDGCGLVYNIRTDRIPPLWFLDGKAPRGWKQIRTSTADIVSRRDYCPRCKDKMPTPSAGKGE